MKAIHKLTIFILIFSPIIFNELYAAELPSVLIRTDMISKQTIRETLHVYGIVLPDPDQSISLSLSHGGYITRVWCRLGQRIKKGDKLLELDASPSSRMQFIQAQRDVDFSRQELAHQQRLKKEQLATRAQVEVAQKALLDAQTNVAALRKQGLEKTHETIVAPMDGIITQLHVTQGQRVQAETTAMLIASEDKLIASLGVEPEDLKFIRPGLRVTLFSVFEADYKAITTVREAHAMINPDTHLVDVLAAVPDEQVDHLVLGSRMKARIELAAHNTLVVPRSALLKDEKGDYIFLVSKGKAHRVKVTRGMDTRKFVGIQGEVQAGGIVVVSGNYELQDGMSVREAN